MRATHILFSAVHLIVVLLIVSVGGMLACLPLSPKLRFVLTMALINSPEAFARVGIGFVTTGVLLFAGFFAMNRRRYIQFKMKGISIDPSVAETYVREYWSKLFPGKDVEVLLRNPNLLEVIAQIPDATEELLVRVEKELGALFATKLGYRNEFILTIH
jgi:hypothetical protein